ncbi:MAG TPA: TIGR03663 family protein [Anaerolineaceae bacterium]|nr:TIGR03663 family protein [Anaerolineaceae bacterium]
MTTQRPDNAPRSWLERPLRSLLDLRVEAVVFAVIVLLTAFSRLYELGLRVMSHDESLHVYFSWLLARGQGFQHTPMMHGPLQFHLLALSYFLFGDTDFTARLPHAIASILTVAFLWKWRRYLGSRGTLIAALLMLISPYMLYYGRYARNEALVALFGVVMLWAILRYLETGGWRYLVVLTVVSALHFTAKETAFIYTAQALLFLGVLLLDRVLRDRWPRPAYRTAFLISLMAGVALLALAVATARLLSASGATGLNPATVAQPAIPGAQPPTEERTAPLAQLLAGGGLAAFLLSLFYLLRGYTWARLREDRALALIFVLFTPVLPQLAPLPMHLLGWDALDYSPTGILHTALFVVPLTLLAVALGLAWDHRRWPILMALYYAIFVVFYTTVFTNGQGFFSGLVGALGYWLQQQGVHRGSQPWYYYLVIQIPIYEYLPALGSLAAALWVGLHSRGKPSPPGVEETSGPHLTETTPKAYPAPVFGLLAYWSLTSFLAYTIAGEKMPWLTVHITLPMILLTSWFLGRVADGVDWGAFSRRHGWALWGLILVFLFSMAATLGAWLGPNRPFAGRELPQLQATAQFLTALVTALLSGYGIARLAADWPWDQLPRTGVLAFFTILAGLTVHTAVQATFYNYDQANEYLVYAHSARGVKDVLRQVTELSLRTHDSLEMPVAYDSDVAWPMTWYLRHFTNQRFYGDSPTRDLRDVPAIIVGDNDFAKIEPIVRQDYYRFDYIRMVWPDQDYFGLTWERIRNALSNPEMRAALFQIWLNRDFTQYAQVTGKDTLTQSNWQPSDRMRLYLRKDIVAQIWDYGVAPQAVQAPEETDPYQGKQITHPADTWLAGPGETPFHNPRAVAVAPDGTLYVADSGNHRIIHLSADGQVLQTWGTFGDINQDPDNAPPGTFNEPWGIAVGPDGSVHVADTWNHRIQKFTADGQFITQWGTFGTGETGYALWGPRDIVIDAQGRVLVTDTGNKRVVAYDADGNFLFAFGSAGVGAGQFDEPVGLALAPDGTLYVADTWNQRIQAFAPTEDGYTYLREWPIYGWFGQSLENKPYLAVDQAGRVYASDPEGYRILGFSSEGDILAWWGDYGVPPDGLGVVNGLAFDPQGNLWVADAGNSLLVRFAPWQP